MEKTIILKSVSIFIFFWGIAVVFLWFRPKIEFFWKIIATLIFFFYLWFFYDEVSRGLAAMRADWYTQVITFLKEFLVLIFVNMFVFWPAVLMVVFYKSDDIGAERLLKFVCVVTLVLWIAFSAYVFYDKKIDQFLYEKLRQLIPFARH